MFLSQNRIAGIFLIGLGVLLLAYIAIYCTPVSNKDVRRYWKNKALGILFDIFVFWLAVCITLYGSLLAWRG